MNMCSVHFIINHITAHYLSRKNYGTNLTFDVLMTMTGKVTEYWNVMSPNSSEQRLSVSWKRKWSK